MIGFSFFFVLREEKERHYSFRYLMVSLFFIFFFFFKDFEPFSRVPIRNSARSECKMFTLASLSLESRGERRVVVVATYYFLFFLFASHGNGVCLVVS